MNRKKVQLRASFKKGARFFFEIKRRDCFIDSQSGVLSGYSFEIPAEVTLKQKVHYTSNGFFVLRSVKSHKILLEFLKRKNMAKPRTFYFHIGALRKGKATPAEVTTIHKGFKRLKPFLF